MELKDISYEVFNLENTPAEEHAGVTGKALWKTIQRGNVRMRVVDYSPGYLADHWCEKGHALFVLEGSFISELKNGSKQTLTKGMGYLVADNASAHRAYTENGVKLLIVD
jgi:hypothetical protein